MEASLSAATGGVFVVTHVIPAASTAETQNRPENVWFSRGRLEALGTVQILTGLVVFLFGIIQPLYGDSLVIISGVFIWAALTFITAGSVTVAAGSSSNRHLVKAAVGFSVFAAVTSAAATIIYCANAIICCNDVYYPNHMQPCYDGYCDRWNYYWVPSVGVSCVLAVFCVLELIVSICIAVFGCRALCHTTDQPPVIMINRLTEAVSQTQTAPPTYEAPPLPETPPLPEDSYERMKPPDYDTDMV